MYGVLMGNESAIVPVAWFGLGVLHTDACSLVNDQGWPIIIILIIALCVLAAVVADIILQLVSLAHFGLGPPWRLHLNNCVMD